LSLLTAGAALLSGTATVQAADKKPNIITIISDDFGYGDAGPYGGGEGRGMPTPSLDRMAKEGMAKPVKSPQIGVQRQL
jgi:arylsulfatase